MSKYKGIGDAISSLFDSMVLIIAIAVPLAIWKVVDIILWLLS